MAGEVSYTFTPNQAGKDRLLHDTGGPYGQWLARLGNDLVNAAKPLANVDTGLMRSRIEFVIAEEGGELTLYLVARTSYAVFVHDGTAYYAGNPFLRDAIAQVVR